MPNDQVKKSASMSGRECLLAAIHHEEPQRVPVAPRVWAWLIGHYGDASLATYLRFCEEFGIELYGLESPYQGIVHVIGPELGLTQPGMTIVCGDSHTSTHGAFGALAFGIGTSEVEHVLATQCLRQSKPMTFRVELTGTLTAGVTAKDMILNLIRHIGTDGATGFVLEYGGAAIRSLSKTRFSRSA